MLVLLGFVDDELNDYEVTIEDGLDFFMLDKLIEPLAPPSPGGAEIDEDAFAVLGRLLAGFGQEVVRARGGQGCG